MVADLVPDAIPLDAVVPLYEELDRIERLASTAKTLLARRVDESRQWVRCGYASAAEYMAAKSGSSVSTAKASLSASEKLAALPVVEDAMRAGRLSSTQANVIAHAAAAAPSQQSRLVDEAQRASLVELRNECLRTKAGADTDREATHARITRERCVRTYTDGEGAWNLHARGPVDAGSRFEARMRELIDDEFSRARAEDRHEPRDAYAFDAVIRMADTRAHEPVLPSEGDAKGGNAKARNARARNLTLVRVDLEALRRGDVADDELCEITGLGPIPVSVARDLLGESIVKLVITKGVDVLHVTHLGRGPSAAQRVALLWQQPLCSVEGCSRTRVEIDHREDWARTHHTRLDECDPLCKHHHDCKTYVGWSLVEGTGKRPMVPPEDPRHPRYRPPP